MYAVAGHCFSRCACNPPGPPLTQLPDSGNVWTLRVGPPALLARNTGDGRGRGCTLHRVGSGIAYNLIPVYWRCEWAAGGYIVLGNGVLLGVDIPIIPRIAVGIWTADALPQAISRAPEDTPK